MVTMCRSGVDHLVEQRVGRHRSPRATAGSRSISATGSAADGADLTLFDKVIDTRNGHIVTRISGADLAVLPGVVLGDVSAVLLIAIRTYRLIFHPEDITMPRSRPRSSRR